MIRVRRLTLMVLACSLGFLFVSVGQAEQYPESTYQELRWRMAGPFRGGRTRAATGVASQPNVFYVGAVNGGVWKSDDYGRTWNPIFDDQPTQSIGAIAVAPSDPNIVYVGKRRGPAAARSLSGRWYLQIHRCGQDLDPPRPARRAADSRAGRGSPRPESLVCGGTRPSLRPQRGARHFPFDRWRPDLAEGPLQG